MTTDPRSRAGRITVETWCARSAAKSNASVRGSRCSPCCTSRRSSAPSAVSPGSKVTPTSKSRSANHCASRRTCVDLPAPSPPSKEMKMPGGAGVSVTAARLSGGADSGRSVEQTGEVPLAGPHGDLLDLGVAALDGLAGRAAHALEGEVEGRSRELFLAAPHGELHPERPPRPGLDEARAPLVTGARPQRFPADHVRE